MDQRAKNLARVSSSQGFLEYAQSINSSEWPRPNKSYELRPISLDNCGSESFSGTISIEKSSYREKGVPNVVKFTVLKLEEGFKQPETCHCTVYMYTKEGGRLHLHSKHHSQLPFDGAEADTDEQAVVDFRVPRHFYQYMKHVAVILLLHLQLGDKSAWFVCTSNEAKRQN